jgi:hypothetical protein
MRRGSDHEEQGGLYTLKSASSAQEQINSYTVAFEDRVDANNFCFLLESFFEDLGDFSADIVPISIKVNILTWVHLTSDVTSHIACTPTHAKQCFCG